MKKRIRKPTFIFQPFSKKQRQVLNWWTKDSPVKDAEGIIADGAIRSGKTVSMSLSFVMWAMENYDGQNFIMSGKTIGSFTRNVLMPLMPMLTSRGYEYDHDHTENMLTVTDGEHTNYFYMFGGKDERSQDLIQGITAAGAFFDEVALMPESFVNQATGRCSVEGSKMWFNCNPASPLHWFKRRWIDKAKEKGLLYLHFTMDDNLSLSEKIKARYRALYAGVFFLRYIKGLWAVAEGLIYPMMTDANLYTDEERPIALYSTAMRTITVDYGTANPTVFLDVYDDGDVVYYDNEYRWDSRSEEAQRTGKPNKTDAEYADEMLKFIGEEPERMCQIVVDPSAKSFITELRQRGLYVKEGKNDVLDGIRTVSSMLTRGKIKINKDRCQGTITEMRTYAWDEKAALHGEEKPIKAADHGCDGLRYYIMTILPEWRRNGGI